MARPKTELGSDADAKILAMHKRGIGHREIAKKLRAGGCQVSDRTVARRIDGLGPVVKVARAKAMAEKVPSKHVKGPLESGASSDAHAPLSDAERKVDALLARSPVWLRIQRAIASALASYPAAAAAVARELREVSL